MAPLLPAVLALCATLLPLTAAQLVATIETLPLGVNLDASVLQVTIRNPITEPTPLVVAVPANYNLFDATHPHNPFNITDALGRPFPVGTFDDEQSAIALPALAEPPAVFTLGPGANVTRPYNAFRFVNNTANAALVDTEVTIALRETQFDGYVYPPSADGPLDRIPDLEKARSPVTIDARPLKSTMKLPVSVEWAAQQSVERRHARG
ncbi:MAG: hypothetical protein M1833_005033 [Piccolia ochrophora]|nr:MAG: hypothetical protein M1833_005033 [Piccolia ochrophora]